MSESFSYRLKGEGALFSLGRIFFIRRERSSGTEDKQTK